MLWSCVKFEQALSTFRCGFVLLIFGKNVILCDLVRVAFGKDMFRVIQHKPFAFGLLFKDYKKIQDGDKGCTII